MRKVATLILLAGWVFLGRRAHTRSLKEMETRLTSPKLWHWTNAIRPRSTLFAGPDFCKNITLGYSTTLTNLLAGAEAGTPDPGWDFEPDTLTINQGTVVSVVDQGGEPHTFTEVKAFGNGFLPPLNPGSSTSVIPECAAALAPSRSPGPEFFKAARSISLACRKESICSNAASIPGCGWKWT